MGIWNCGPIRNLVDDYAGTEYQDPNNDPDV
jgi:hypothetical protein